MGDTPVKTVHNRQYIDNISAYDSDLQRTSKSVHHKLDLGQNSLPRAQQYTTVKAAADIKVQDKAIKVQDKAIKAQDNASGSSDIDSHDYLDLANIETKL